MWFYNICELDYLLFLIWFALFSENVNKSPKAKDRLLFSVFEKRQVATTCLLGAWQLTRHAASSMSSQSSRCPTWTPHFILQSNLPSFTESNQTYPQSPCMLLTRFPFVNIRQEHRYLFSHPLKSCAVSLWPHLITKRDPTFMRINKIFN